MHTCIYTFIHMYLPVYAYVLYMCNVTKSYTVLNTACHIERSLSSLFWIQTGDFFLCCCDVFWVIEHLELQL